MKFLHALASFGILTALLSCQSAPTQTATAGQVLDTYIAIAHATYEDSLLSARHLDQAVDALLTDPTAATLTRARQAWLDARVPYQQSEAFRFGNPVVDAWEGRVNAWPLDEGLIDYTAAAYGTQSDNNYFYAANIIANPRLNIGGISVDAGQITPVLLSQTLHEIDGVESNVATGYHAIEFLLWGQDLNGTAPGAGNRPATDYSLQNCSNGNCDRRRDYLKAATELLLADLEEMVANWEPGGAAYVDLRAKGEQGGIATILTGLGSLAYGELAGERTRLALLLNDPEEEHDCFSDNTHNSHFYDARGIRNVYEGQYRRIDGSLIQGPAIADLIAGTDSALADSMTRLLDETESAAAAMVQAAGNGQTFDVLIAGDNLEGEAIVSRFIDALVAETGGIERVIAALELDNITIEGSDSLDNPALVL